MRTTKSITGKRKRGGGTASSMGGSGVSGKDGAMYINHHESRSWVDDLLITLQLLQDASHILHYFAIVLCRHFFLQPRFVKPFFCAAISSC